MITPFCLGILLAALSAVAPSGAGAAFLLLLAVLSFADAVGRMADYVRITDALHTYKKWDSFPDLIYHRFKGSHCQRQAMQLAAWTVNSAALWEVNARLHRDGYRWWHVMPDWFYKRPMFVLNRRFWKSFLGL